MQTIKRFFEPVKEDLKNLFAGPSNKLNLYFLVGRTPFWQTFLFALEHLVAMFASNIIPIIIVFSALGIYGSSLSVNALLGSLFIAGLTTASQALIGGRLPIVYGSSFTYVAIFCSIGTSVITGGGTPEMAYYTILGSCLVGAPIGILFALLYRFWGKAIKPIVPALVVLGIGLSLLQTGATSFFGGEDVLLGASSALPLYAYILVAVFTLLVMILWTIFAKGLYKNLSVAVALFAGFALSCCIPGMVDFSSMAIDSSALVGAHGIVAYPTLIDFGKLRFEMMPIIMTSLLFVLSNIEALGSYNAISTATVGGAPRDEDVTRGLSGMGFGGLIGSMFGAFPLTAYAQNVSLCVSSQVINRLIMVLCGGLLVFASFIPPLANLILAIPTCVIGAIMVSLFGSIAIVGMEMVLGVKRSRKNNMILSIALALGFGISLSAPIKTYFTNNDLLLVYEFISSPVLCMFLIGLILSWALPDDMGATKSKKGKKKEIGEEKSEVAKEEPKE